MAKDQLRNDPFAIIRMHAENMAGNVVCTMLELAHDFARAQEAAALAEADCKHPAKVRALYLNGPADPSKTPPDTSPDASPTQLRRT